MMIGTKQVMNALWADNGSVRALVLGAGAFVVLFWVYASSLQYAELAVVTMGWIVLLQVGIYGGIPAAVDPTALADPYRLSLTGHLADAAAW